LDLSTTIKGWLSDEVEQEEVVSLAQQLGSDQANEIALEKLEALADGPIQIGNMTYDSQDLIKAFRDVDADGSGIVTRSEWRSAKAHDWKSYWTWPIILALVTGVFFWLGFHDKPTDDEKKSPKSE
jgi:hypothetical protein